MIRCSTKSPCASFAPTNKLYQSAKPAAFGMLLTQATAVRGAQRATHEAQKRLQCQSNTGYIRLVMLTLRPPAVPHQVSQQLIPHRLGNLRGPAGQSRHTEKSINISFKLCDCHRQVSDDLSIMAAITVRRIVTGDDHHMGW